MVDLWHNKGEQVARCGWSDQIWVWLCVSVQWPCVLLQDRQVNTHTHTFYIIKQSARAHITQERDSHLKRRTSKSSLGLDANKPQNLIFDQTTRLYVNDILFDARASRYSVLVYRESHNQMQLGSRRGVAKRLTTVEYYMFCVVVNSQVVRDFMVDRGGPILVQHSMLVGWASDRSRRMSVTHQLSILG